MPTTAVPLTLNPVGAVANIVGGTSIGLANQTGVTSIPSFTAITGSAVITITPTFGGCVGVAQTTTITVNNCTPLTVTTSLARQPNRCLGNRACINTEVTSGTAPYTYSWKRNTVSIASATQDLITVQSGTYEVTVTDFLGAIGTSTVVVPTLSATTLAANPVIGGASLTVNPTGGVPPYRYQWIKSDGSFDFTNSINEIGINNFSPVCYVTDAEGCQKTGPIPAYITGFSVAPQIGDGTGEVMNSGGVRQNRILGAYPISTDLGQSYTHLWSTGSTSTILSVPQAGGTYTCTVTQSPIAATKTFTVIVPALPTITINNTVTASSGGLANGAINVTGVLNTTGPLDIIVYRQTTNEIQSNLNALFAGNYFISIVVDTFLVTKFVVVP